MWPLESEMTDATNFALTTLAGIEMFPRARFLRHCAPVHEMLHPAPLMLYRAPPPPTFASRILIPIKNS